MIAQALPMTTEKLQMPLKLDIGDKTSAESFVQTAVPITAIPVSVLAATESESEMSESAPKAVHH